MDCANNPILAVANDMLDELKAADKLIAAMLPLVSMEMLAASLGVGVREVSNGTAFRCEERGAVIARAEGAL